MNITEAIDFVKSHHLSSLKRSTNMGYTLFFNHLKAHFDGQAIESITSNEIGQFLESFTAGVAKATRHLRYAQTKAFLNFIINECGLDIKNPCAHPLLAKQYKNPKTAARQILDKELVDELIYSSSSTMKRLILELQARCGLRIGEVLKLKATDVMDRKLLIREPKSGKESETAFMPEQIAKRQPVVSWPLFRRHVKSPRSRLCYDKARSKRSRFMTLFHTATKSCRNFFWESS